MCSQKWPFLDSGSQRATSARGSGQPAHGCGCRQGEDPQRAGAVGVQSLHMLAGVWCWGSWGMWSWWGVILRVHIIIPWIREGIPGVNLGVHTAVGSWHDIGHWTFTFANVMLSVKLAWYWTLDIHIFLWFFFLYIFIRKLCAPYFPLPHLIKVIK